MKFIHLIFLCVAASLLASCGDSAPEYANADNPKTNRIALVRHEHVVRFAGNATTLEPEEAARLSRFLADDRSQSSATIAVGPGVSGAIASARATAVRQALASRGYRSVDVLYVASADALNQVRVTTTAAVAITPRCPDYSKPTEYNYSNTRHSNYGCADAHNLGVMVADPADLARGRDEGSEDGTAAVLGIQRYRAGKVTPLKDSDTGSGAPGGK